jgi:hypothetical protein
MTVLRIAFVYSRSLIACSTLARKAVTFARVSTTPAAFPSAPRLGAVRSTYHDPSLVLISRWTAGPARSDMVGQLLDVGDHAG